MLRYDIIMWSLSRYGLLFLILFFAGMGCGNDRTPSRDYWYIRGYNELVQEYQRLNELENNLQGLGVFFDFDSSLSKSSTHQEIPNRIRLENPSHGNLLQPEIASMRLQRIEQFSAAIENYLSKIHYQNDTVFITPSTPGGGFDYEDPWHAKLKLSQEFLRKKNGE